MALPGQTEPDSSPEAARAKIAETLNRFLYRISSNSNNVFLQYLGFLEREFGFNFALAWAMRVSTGGGKTQIAVRVFGSTTLRFLCTVPILELAERSAQQYRDVGLSVAVLRGRDAPDPANPGQLMCLTPELVKVAVAAHLDVNESCCKPCKFKHKCSYLAQKQQQPQVWIAAHNVLFHQEEALGKFDFIVVDESMWPTALVGIDADEMITLPLEVFNDSTEEARIALKFDSQPADGGLQWQYFDDQLLHTAINQLWHKIGELRKQLDLKRPDQRLIGELTLAHEKKQICEELLRLGEGTSGRLILDHHKGQRVIKWRGKKEISAQYRTKPTLLLDATLPGTRILKELHENIREVANINVALPPSVFIRQVLGAPTGDIKLADEKHRQALRRHILKRFIEIGRQKTVVICQKEYREWLGDTLPKEIEFLHYNALVGLDDKKDVRLMLLIGRTQPGPEAPEVQAGALTGVMPAPATHRNLMTGFGWYTPKLRYIKLKNGRGVPVYGDAHPDPLVEEIRWQICEAELLQAFGRARAINRTAETPLDVELLFNTVLPLAVDTVTDWEEPSLRWETAAEGVMLTSPVDLMKVWPGLWPNKVVTKQTEPLPALPGFVEVTYQLAGPRMNKRIGYFDLALIPDPRGWLATRLGGLKDLPGV